MNVQINKCNVISQVYYTKCNKYLRSFRVPTGSFTLQISGHVTSCLFKVSADRYPICKQLSASNILLNLCRVFSFFVQSSVNQQLNLNLTQSNFSNKTIFRTLFGIMKSVLLTPEKRFYKYIRESLVTRYSYRCNTCI